MTQTITASIGIDLGTTYLCVGIWNRDQVEIMVNDEGHRTTPTCVSFTDDGFFVGDHAKNMLYHNPKNTIFDVKRFIGKKYSEIDVHDLTYEIVNIDDVPFIKTVQNDKIVYYTPQEISCIILSKIHQFVTDYLGHHILDTVITIPAHFNDAQRRATKEAGEKAGFNVLRIINEPTAAALAYGFDKIDEKSNILVFDFGGGTLDVTILTMEEGVFQVRATCGIPNLGGEDFDDRLVNWCVEDFKKKFNKDLKSSSKSMRRLKLACEEAKKILSLLPQTSINIDSIYVDIDYSVIITRAKFEELCIDLLSKIMDPVKKVLNDSRMNRENINEIVLVGGSTKIPKVKEIISNFFNGKSLNESTNPDEAIAYGATIQAAILSNVKNNQLQEITLIDVIPLSLGLEVNGGIMVKIINRNTPIPCKESKIFSTSHDNQTVVKINIYEGEEYLTKDNHKLGTFNLTGIFPDLMGTPHIEVVFKVDSNGILNVEAIDKSSNHKNDIKIIKNQLPQNIE